MEISLRRPCCRRLPGATCTSRGMNTLVGRTDSQRLDVLFTECPIAHFHIVMPLQKCRLWSTERWPRRGTFVLRDSRRVQLGRIDHICWACCSGEWPSKLIISCRQAFVWNHAYIQLKVSWMNDNKEILQIQSGVFMVRSKRSSFMPSSVCSYNPRNKREYLESEIISRTEPARTGQLYNNRTSL